MKHLEIGQFLQVHWYFIKKSKKQKANQKTPADVCMRMCFKYTSYELAGRQITGD